MVEMGSERGLWAGGEPDQTNSIKPGTERKYTQGKVNWFNTNNAPVGETAVKIVLSMALSNDRKKKRGQEEMFPNNSRTVIGSHVGLGPGFNECLTND